MKKFTKILALMLAAVTLLSVMAVPAFAEYTYTMTCTIYYVNGKGAQIASPCTFTVNAANSSSSSTGRKSPSISGYVLKNSGDSFVTYDMMNKSFPSSNYDRKGSATYTVEYTDVTFHTINFIDRATGNALARAVVLGGKPGTSYTQNCPAFPNYTATKTVASGRFSTTSRSSSENIYYYKTIYTMSYNANGGSGAPSSESKESGKNYTISSVRPTRSGYSFAGWAMHDSATSASYQPGDTFTGNYNATFFAVWTANQYRISYDANGGSGAPSSQIKYNDVPLTLSYGKPSRSGYTFKGWGLSSSSTSATYQPGSTYNYNASRTLYAVWEKDAPPAPTTYTVSYNANGGSGAPSSQTKTKDIALTLSSTRPTKSGYTFKGWSESSYATSASYQPGGQYTANASTVLYAIWECSHPSIDTVWDTGCKWRNVCRICKATLSSGTTHGPYVYGNLEYYSESTHRRTKDCTHGDYSTYEYFSHNKTGKYQQYSSTQHKKYFYCNDCNSSIGTGYYESHDFITTTVDGQSTSVCLLCGYTKSSVKTYIVSYNANGGSRAPSSQTKIHDLTLILSNDIPYRSKRLGLCSKSMFVVPNHLINQWASEYLQLYPSANILVATKKDFETKNRKKFCARIATGDYDAIIIGHSQFEKIPMSSERQAMMLQNEIDELMDSISELKESRGERFTIKQLEKTKKQLQLKLDKLNDRSRKDDVVTFEQLGVDRLFVDEAHFYKNLAAYTKMRNVAGISQTEAQKSSDLYMKCRYLDEITGGKGVTFATGTPISNTMVELYTMQKYLQYDALKEKGLTNFDAWASTFGETVTAIELDPTGTGYRAKTRFAKFFNIPELMAMFKEVADVQTADMLNLPVPMANFHVEKEPSSEIQKEMVQSFADRAAKVHSHMVSSDEDNMLLITNDGRKAALDQRLLNPDLPDFEESKVNHCVRNVVDIWKRTAEQKSAQLVFCDLSTPHHDGKFNVYDDIRKKLIEEGIPESEIAFIHDADTDAKKKDLFSKVRSGQVRVLMGSTFKMGAGTNVQERLIALHDLDVPWRPSDLEQRLGRIVRQGNSNPEVEIYRYVTEGTFDAYMYQLLESKQKFISQIMTSKSPVRCAEDVDDTALSYAEIKALASGNPKIMEKMQLDADVAKLKLQKSAHLSERYMLEDQLFKDFPKEVSEEEERIAGYGADIEIAKENTHKDEKGFSPMIVQGKEITVKAEAGKAILAFCKKMTNPDLRPLGEYRGFKTEIGFDIFGREFFMMLRGKLGHRVTLGQDANGIITRLDNAIDSLFTKQCHCKERLAELKQQIENAKREVATPFPREEELTEKLKRLDELNAELNMDKQENELVDGERDGDETPSESKESRPENDRQEREQDDDREEECR